MLGEFEPNAEFDSESAAGLISVQGRLRTHIPSFG